MFLFVLSLSKKQTNILQYRDKLFPPLDRTNQVTQLNSDRLLVHSILFQRIPTDQAGVRAEIARIKAERIARRAQREEERKNAEE